MHVVIDNVTFDFNTGCKVLKSKHRECPFPEIVDFWDDITPLDFKQVAAIENLEARRVALLYLGIESILEQANATLVKSETLNKTTTWVSDDGSLVEHKFDDTYELWAVDRAELLGQEPPSWQSTRDMAHFIRMKDTSTDRQYLIWVDMNSVASTNARSWGDVIDNSISPIAAIAWTIQTTVPSGQIKRIIRQGDCILIEPTSDYDTQTFQPTRHLTEVEYRNFLVLES